MSEPWWWDSIGWRDAAKAELTVETGIAYWRGLDLYNDDFPAAEAYYRAGWAAYTGPRLTPVERREKQERYNRLEAALADRPHLRSGWHPTVPYRGSY